MLSKQALVPVIVLVGVFATSLLTAQVQNPIQAAKDAYNQSRRQQVQQQKQQPQQPQSSAQTGGSRAGSAAQSAPTQLGPDCCTADALKRIASTVGFIDVVGIKLGMTPQEALAAIKAANPKLKIDTENARIEPGDAPGTFKRYPRFVVARTLEPPAGGMEQIALEFTLPPSPPLVGKIIRTVTFPQGQPVVITTLLDAMRKKYGQENFPRAQVRAWLFGADGKLITRQLNDREQYCIPADVYNGMGNFQMPVGNNPVGDAGSVNLSGTAAQQGNSERQLVCRPFTIVMTPVGEDYAPNSQMNDMTVMVESPALLDSGWRATHDWLQSQADGKAKQRDNAAQQRSAPKL